jgi:uncharacterized membrane protein YphA (DoxX/SURF4 family)
MSGTFHWIERQLAGAWSRAQRSAANDAGDLAITRVVFGLFALLINPPSLVWLGDLPQGLFGPQPLNIARFFGGFPPVPWLIFMNAVLVLTAACLVLGVRARIASVIFAGLSITGSSFQYSLGKIDHGIMFPLAILILSATNWGTKYAIVPDPRRNSRIDTAAPAFLAILLCYGFFTAGALKAVFWSDINPDTGGFLSWFYNRRFGESNAPLAEVVVRVPQGLFELFDVGAVCFELAPFPMLMLGWRWWRTWIVMACLFHVMTILLLDISFVGHIAVYLSFIPAKEVWRRLNAGISTSRWRCVTRANRRSIACLMVSSLTIVHLLRLLRGLPVVSPLESVWTTYLPSGLYWVVVPLLMWLITLLVSAMAVFGPAPPGANVDTA